MPQEPQEQQQTATMPQLPSGCTFSLLPATSVSVAVAHRLQICFSHFFALF